MRCVNHILRCLFHMPDGFNHSIPDKHIHPVKQSVIRVTCHKMLNVLY